MKRLLWITDAHLDHLSDMAADAWFEMLGKSRAAMPAGSAYGRIDHSGMITLGQRVSVLRLDR
jgi:hypothetical protein